MPGTAAGKTHILAMQSLRLETIKGACKFWTRPRCSCEGLDTWQKPIWAGNDPQ